MVYSHKKNFVKSNQLFELLSTRIYFSCLYMFVTFIIIIIIAIISSLVNLCIFCHFSSILNHYQTFFLIFKSFLNIFHFFQIIFPTFFIIFKSIQTFLSSLIHFQIVCHFHHLLLFLQGTFGKIYANYAC